MKQFFLEFFTWWNSATLGTRFHTWRHGTPVGSDEFGNLYYRDGATDRRWVIYAGSVDPSTIPPGWHGWIHHKVDTAPSSETYRARDWQRAHRPNQTGTPLAYRPKGSLLGGKERPKVAGDYEAWKP